ncbi:hypothetical protein [Nannocystis pusilla]|uniref:Uncharacterized protein n=1 Tax=Nannocystis pusilla TaxID=889268 RepID=A0ABS7TZM9_9BACT|nr:hypothetical protein [Nannocystis pusilla]MBZ5713476.1 hypothetical protein [Nannocystis pusilla]
MTGTLDVDAHPVRRALLDRPQRLGFLPTWWFWNHYERQRLTMPLIATLAVPLTLLFLFLMAWLQLPVWLFLVFGTAWPQLVLGLVERRVRRSLRQRTLDGMAGVPAPEPSPSHKPVDGVTLSLAGLGAFATVVAVAGTWGLAPALWTGLALAMFAALAGGRLAKRERDALALAGSNEPGQLPPPPETRP